MRLVLFNTYFCLISSFKIPFLLSQDNSFIPSGQDKLPERTLRGNSSASILTNLANIPSLSKLYALVQESPILADALASLDANLTLFAPVDSAFPQILQDNDFYDTLLYHIVHPSLEIALLENGVLLDSGLNLASLGDKNQKIKVFNRYNQISLNWHAKIESVSIQCSNGWIHLIDAILKPPSALPSHMKYFPLQFSILSFALRRTGVALILNEIQGATLFAPTNGAFLKLGWKKLKFLFSDNGISELTSILLYHITPNLLYSDDIYREKELYVRSLFHNLPLNIVVSSSDDILVNDESKVVGIPDQLGNNGVMHPVDRVVMPKEEYLV